jgi:hypothetical protein
VDERADSDRGVRRTALVLDGGGAQSVVLVRVLGSLGWDVLCEAGTRSSRSRWTTATVDLPTLGGPDADPDAYVQRLRDICEQCNVQIVAPSSDLTLAYCWQAALEEDTIAGARILGGDRRTAEVFTDKAAGIEAARRHGFPVPETRGGETADDLVRGAEDIGFPCVVKPRHSFLWIDGALRQVRHVYVRDAGEARAAVRALTSDDGVLPLVQEYLVGRSCSATAVIHRGSVLASSARETLSFYPIGGGTSVWKRTIPDSTPGVKESVALMQEWGLDGLAEVEYVLTSRGPRFMELGPRMHGWIPLAEASSPGLLATAVRTTLGENLVPLAPYRTNVEMRWIGGELLRLRDGLDPRSQLPRSVSRLGVLRTAWPPWRPAMRYDGVDLLDLGPLLPQPFRYLVASRNGSVARIAENDAPLTKRQKGPNVPSAG